MDEKIAVVGRGYVGNKIYEFFKSHSYKTFVFDIDRIKSDVDKIEDLNKYDLDFAFICVPTPMSHDGSCDTSIVEDCVKKISAKTIVIESTISPGTTLKLEKETSKDILFTPEYFGETKNHPLNSLNEREFFIIGGRPEVRSKLIELYKDIFQSTIKFGLYDSKTAEVIKYMENSFLATKVIFCEEFYEICKNLGVDYYQVREGWLMDPRINPSHTFPRKGGVLGFGGKCLPKDVSAIIRASELEGYNPEFLKAVQDYNLRLKKGGEQQKSELPNSNEGISVVIPLYGDFDIKRTLLCINSIKMQKEVDIEIVVSEQGIARRFPDIPSVKHTFTYHKPQANLSDFNPGKVRNIAIMNSSKDYIYTCDADVVFSDPFFMKKLLSFLKKHPDRVLYRPFMRRLPLDNFEEFSKWNDSLGIEGALKKLIINQDFLVKTSPEYRELKIFEKISKEAGYKKTFTSLIEDYKKYVEERLGSDSDFNFWPVYWNENRHCGSNFFKRTQFMNVGGYCEKFINWGCEDSDLQWKFRETYNLEFFPIEFEVIHLDHPKGYLSPKMWFLNEEKSAERKRGGVKSAIEYDKTVLNREYS